MAYVSNILSDYNAVLTHVDKMQKVYAEYGISFKWDVLLSEQGYRVEAVPQELEVSN